MLRCRFEDGCFGRPGAVVVVDSAACDLSHYALALFGYPLVLDFVGLKFI